MILCVDPSVADVGVAIFEDRELVVAWLTRAKGWRTMRETQMTIAEWARSTFGPSTKHASWMRARKEFEELVKNVGEWLTPDLSIQTIHGFKRLERKVVREMADVVICFMRLAEQFGFDLMDEVDIKMAINRLRDWESHGDGTGQHVKPEGIYKRCLDCGNDAARGFTIGGQCVVCQSRDVVEAMGG